ncbi:MAG: AbiEi antitoxin N-terminal domain-containing protein [Desulfurivibrio sp.]|nr:AbiEi antitoxin N-terminal domain-containing protein [Desulfurivibrio sp.]
MRKTEGRLNAVLPGFMVDSAWLERHEISRFLARKYVDHDWLERVARGVFRRPTPTVTSPDTFDWKICLLSMQHIMGYKLHVGGMTALTLHGYRHYLPLGGNSPVWLYGVGLPNWLHELPLNVKLQTRNVSLFADPTLGMMTEGKSTGQPGLGPTAVGLGTGNLLAGTCHPRSPGRTT